MKRPEFCKQEKTDEAVVHLNPTDAASIQLWWSSLSRWEQHKHGSRSKLFKRSLIKRFEVLHQASATPVRTSGRGGGDENEEEQAQRAASRQMGQPAPGGRN